MSAKPWRERPPLEIWTVYRTRGGFHVVRFEVQDGALVPVGDVVSAATLDDVRAALPLGLAMFPRSDEDDPSIVECWL